MEHTSFVYMYLNGPYRTFCQLSVLLFVYLFCLAFSFMFHFCIFFLSRASRDEMAASTGATAFPKSDSQNSGLVGNIHGQDVEASKGGSGGLVY